MRESVVYDALQGGGGAVRRSGLILLIVVVLGLTAVNSVSCVRTGHVGVVTVFGRVTGRTMPEGIHVVNRWRGYTSSTSRRRRSRNGRRSPLAKG